MDTKQLTTTDTTSIAAITTLVLDGLTSHHSKRAYSKALGDFLSWYDAQGRPGLSKAVVQAYSVKLQGDGLAPSTVNLRLSAIRKLASEASDNGLIDPTLAAAIGRVKGVTSGGRRAGNWLSKEQAQELLEQPDTTTLKGVRDRAILAVLLGAGLRREEAARLTFDHIQQRDGRWVLLDIVGKRNKTRSVPIASWVWLALDAWRSAAGLDGGRVFRAVNRGGNVWGDGISSQGIWKVVDKYSQEIGLDIAPHDLRRTFAKLAHKGQSGIDQIQLSLGHSSIATTEVYLGTEQDLTDSPGDRLGLRL